MTYRIDRGFRRAAFLSGILFIVIAAALLFVTVWDRELDRGGRITTGCIAVACAAFAWWVIHLMRHADRYEVEITDFGIRVGPAAAVPWSAIVRLRERPSLHRLELLGMNGEALAKIEYQVEKAEEVIATAAARLGRGEQTAAPEVFGKRRPAGYIVANVTFFVGAIALAWWLWVESGSWIGALVPPLFGWDSFPSSGKTFGRSRCGRRG